jgi:GrpB-like predicted nucleotidyltransferase (UPF0157 family)
MRISLVESDPTWPELFRREAERIHTALGSKALQVEHVGSTSVPVLIAKPAIDIVLVVADSADEESYLPALRSYGYPLHHREPEWHQHRMLKGPDTRVNLHVFSAGCSEIERHLLFRNWLRSNSADRDLYARTKLALAQQKWARVQDYADAKTPVITEILARARQNFR